MEEHGKFTLHVDNRVIVTNHDFGFDNGFNIEGARLIFHQMLAIIEDLKPEPWANLSIFHSDSLVTNDSESELRAMSTFCEENGLTHAAYVNANIVLKELISKVRKNDAGHFRFFSNAESAADWLRSEGFEMHSFKP